eukprot:424325_1
MGSRNTPNKWKFKISYNAPVKPKPHIKRNHAYVTTSWNIGTPLVMDLCSLIAYIRHLTTGLNVTTLIYDVAGSIQLLICRKTGKNIKFFDIKNTAKWCYLCYGRSLDLVVFNYLSPFLMAQAFSYMRPYIRVINSTIQLHSNQQSEINQLNQIIKQKDAIINLQSELLGNNLIILDETKIKLLTATSNDNNDDSSNSYLQQATMENLFNYDICIGNNLDTLFNENESKLNLSPTSQSNDNGNITIESKTGIYIIDDAVDNLPKLPNESYQQLYTHSNDNNQIGCHMDTNYHSILDDYGANIIKCEHYLLFMKQKIIHTHHIHKI